MHRLKGVRNRIRTLWLPALAVGPSAVLLLAALTALLGCGHASPVLATQLPDGTSADEVPIVDAEFTVVVGHAPTATLLQDNAVLQRSLSQCADSLAASEARALEWERTAMRLQSELAALRSPLEAPPALEEMPEPTAASSLPRSSSSSSNTAQLARDAGRVPYPATLPVSGAQPADDWHRFSQGWRACTHGGRIMNGARVPGFCSCGDACVSTTCDRGRR